MTCKPIRLTAGFDAAFALAVLAVAGLASAQTPAQPPSPPPATLSGPTWALVEFQSMDDTTLKPAAGARYTLSFAEDGRVEIQADCNRGNGTWKSPDHGQLEFGPVAITRRACPPSALEHRFVRDLADVRSFVLRDGRLYLSLLADGGIYAFEPVPGR